MSILINILLAIHVIVSLLIILLTLMQRPKNEGLGAAFGGGMTENLFGAQTSNVLATFTRWLGGIFFVLTLTLSMLYARHTKSGIQQQLLSAPVPAAQASPSAAPVKPAASPVASASPTAAPAVASASPTATPASTAAPVATATPETPAATPAK